MRLVQNSFVGGEISPALFGRHDIEAYFHAAKRITNFTVHGTGGLGKRYGTQLLAKLGTGATSSFKSFAYLYDRTHWMFLLFYTKPNEDTVFYRTVKTDDEPSGELSISADTLEMSDVSSLRIKQQGDTLFLTHRSVQAVKGFVDYEEGTVTWSKAAHVRKPNRPADFTTASASGFSHDSGYVNTSREYCLIGVKNSVYSDVRTKRVGITLPWANGATVTLAFTPSFAGAGDADDYSKYDYYLVGYRAAGSWMVLDTFYPGSETDNKCTLVDNNMYSSSVAGVTEPITVGEASAQFRVGLIDVWEQRLVMASSTGKPFSFWFSRTGDIGNFHASRPQAADDAFEATLATLSAARILHTVTGRWFLMFTNEGEYRIDSSGAGFSFATMAIRKTSNVGAHEDVEPVTSDSHVLFCAPDAKSVYALAYDLEQDNILPRNVSLLAGHMTEGRRIVDMAFVKFPEPRLLALLDDGDVICMTYLPEQKVTAWHRAHFGYDGLKCVAISCCGAMREADGAEVVSEILLLFQRPGDSSAFWLERVRAPSYGDVRPQGLALCADHCGYAADDCPVAGENPQTPVEAEVVTLRPELQEANSIGLRKNIYDCTVRLNRSGAVTIAPEGDDMDEASSTAQPDSVPAVDDEAGTVALVTKDVAILPRARHNKDGRMVIRSADQWPCEILSVLFNIEVAREEGDQ